MGCDRRLVQMHHGWYVLTRSGQHNWRMAGYYDSEYDAVATNPDVPIEATPPVGVARLRAVDPSTLMTSIYDTVRKTRPRQP